MLKFCFSGNVFYPIGRVVASRTNLLAHPVVKQMEGISELLPEEYVQKLKRVLKSLPLQDRGVGRGIVDAYMQKLAEMGVVFESVGFGMWEGMSEMDNSSKWVEGLKKRFDERVKRWADGGFITGDRE